VVAIAISKTWDTVALVDVVAPRLFAVAESFLAGR